MYTKDTIREYSKAKKKVLKLVGARLDYKLTADLNEYETDSFIKELKLFCNSSGLQLSGVGYKNYSGILMGDLTPHALKLKIVNFKKWFALRNRDVKMARIGRVKFVNDIFFE